MDRVWIFSKGERDFSWAPAPPPPPPSQRHEGVLAFPRSVNLWAFNRIRRNVYAWQWKLPFRLTVKIVPIWRTLFPSAKRAQDGLCVCLNEARSPVMAMRSSQLTAQDSSSRGIVCSNSFFCCTRRTTRRTTDAYNQTNRLTLSIPVSSAKYVEPSFAQVGEVYLDPGLLTRAQQQQLLQELDCLYNFL